LKKNDRKATRNGILADFQFYVDNKSEEIFEGMTVNISPDGLCFLTKTSIEEGQTITVTKLARNSTMPDFIGQRAKVIWVEKESRFIEAGVSFR
jgi:hypothetical protein